MGTPKQELVPSGPLPTRLWGCCACGCDAVCWGGGPQDEPGRHTARPFPFSVCFVRLGDGVTDVAEVERAWRTGHSSLS